MKTSQAGIDLICRFEGLRLTAYKPVKTEKYWTIGYGHYGADVKQGQTITKEKAVEYLKADLAKFEAKVNKYSKYNFSQNEFDALVSFAYNVGNIDQLTANGTRSKTEIATKIPAYNKAGGKVLAGLTARRNAEKALFCKAVESPNKPETVKRDTLYYRKPLMTGNDVETWQTYLYKHGYMKQHEIDGIFGKNTDSYTRKCQLDHGLKNDGIVGAKTWAIVR